MIVALFPELMSFGGVQLAGRELAAAASAISRERGGRFRALSLNDARGEHESRVGCTWFEFRGFGRNRFRFLLAALQAAREQPKYILAAHPNLAPVAMVMKYFAGKPQVIVCTHGIEVWRPLSAIRGFSLRRADLVLAPSLDTERRAEEVQHVANKKIHKFSWALDPDFLAHAAASENLPLPAEFPHGLTVLSVGRWNASERYKGADLLIQAVAELATEFRDLHLVLAGSGDDIPRLMQLSQKSGCAERIHFLENLTRGALAACYSKADVFALPSSGEGFGLVFLEAMAMKKPVIGANAGGIPDLVQDGEIGFLVNPKDSVSLVSALRKLLSSAELREKMGKRARETVLSRFSFENFQSELRSILQTEDSS